MGWLVSAACNWTRASLGTRGRGGPRGLRAVFCFIILCQCLCHSVTNTLGLTWCDFLSASRAPGAGSRCLLKQHLGVSVGHFGRVTFDPTTEWCRRPSPVWVGPVQSVDDLNRTGRTTLPGHRGSFCLTCDRCLSLAPAETPALSGLSELITGAAPPPVRVPAQLASCDLGTCQLS